MINNGYIIDRGGVRGIMKIRLCHSYEEIISVENLLCAWEEFVRGKRNKLDVQEFSLRLMDNIIALHDDLANHAYRHGGYEAFKVDDPKPRDIHKASVRDRLLHHAIHRVLCPFFDKKFIADSYSCRIGKGTYKVIDRFRDFSYRVSKNNTRTCWVLKCDIRKFFANIDHSILLAILREYIDDRELLILLGEVVGSFSVARSGVGLPLGNLTSQLLVNIYMNEFDQYVKHELKNKYYIRYSDDFVFFADDRSILEGYIPAVKNFLYEKLRLELHPDKLYIKTVATGVDFLGWINFIDHRILRTTTKQRMMKRLVENNSEEIMGSYLGLLKHGNTHNLQKAVGAYKIT
ncbi:MAG: RNA-directed DNA polymerase (Reverse transcriptase) [Candidatus Wolfebacteria bacterium GW2011_GWC2_46_275]|nr:MAG: RNA-directed DNA polymerase (Reverse transcriptase) [Candidatus Wolfebacteria bacterium GW2011_GWC2_46_275]KKU53833.1 MAG: RNA-directed DNA polymerase (Reverse transcriptase) [Candidatus Wolfebacteria bacterium GW2011_GWC1_47_103]KKU72971.1 MAG: RNA-directed DNA polymerase (Reverse transcriptase) [Candidatus Wolfebacteria bacterium GW2011_GWB1_47_243]HAL25001.1 hypothetical protein [Candidatus Wolfebacteria bacterium]HBN86959.1 hypothetical protein [Candidatus Wolfebacteria bacterium]